MTDFDAAVARLTDVVALSRGNVVYHVRTPEGARKYKAPIGSVIVKDADGHTKILHKGNGKASDSTGERIAAQYGAAKAGTYSGAARSTSHSAAQAAPQGDRPGVKSGFVNKADAPAVRMAAGKRRKYNHSKFGDMLVPVPEGAKVHETGTGLMVEHVDGHIIDHKGKSGRVSHHKPGEKKIPANARVLSSDDSHADEVDKAVRKEADAVRDLHSARQWAKRTGTRDGASIAPHPDAADAVKKAADARAQAQDDLKRLRTPDKSETAPKSVSTPLGTLRVGDKVAANDKISSKHGDTWEVADISDKGTSLVPAGQKFGVAGTPTLFIASDGSKDSEHSWNLMFKRHDGAFEDKGDDKPLPEKVVTRENAQGRQLWTPPGGERTAIDVTDVNLKDLRDVYMHEVEASKRDILDPDPEFRAESRRIDKLLSDSIALRVANREGYMLRELKESAGFKYDKPKADAPSPKAETPKPKVETPAIPPRPKLREGMQFLSASKEERELAKTRVPDPDRKGNSTAELVNTFITAVKEGKTTEVTLAKHGDYRVSPDGKIEKRVGTSDRWTESQFPAGRTWDKLLKNFSAPDIKAEDKKRAEAEKAKAKADQAAQAQKERARAAAAKTRVATLRAEAEKKFLPAQAEGVFRAPDVRNAGGSIDRLGYSVPIKEGDLVRYDSTGTRQTYVLSADGALTRYSMPTRPGAEPSHNPVTFDKPFESYGDVDLTGVARPNAASMADITDEVGLSPHLVRTDDRYDGKAARLRDFSDDDFQFITLRSTSANGPLDGATLLRTANSNSADAPAYIIPRGGLAHRVSSQDMRKLTEYIRQNQLSIGAKGRTKMGDTKPKPELPDVEPAKPTAGAKKTPNMVFSSADRYGTSLSTRFNDDDILYRVQSGPHFGVAVIRPDGTGTLTTAHREKTGTYKTDLTPEMVDELRSKGGFKDRQGTNGVFTTDGAPSVKGSDVDTSRRIATTDEIFSAPKSEADTQADPIHGLGKAVPENILQRYRDNDSLKGTPSPYAKALHEAVRTNKYVEGTDDDGQRFRVMPDGRAATRDAATDSGWKSFPLNINELAGFVDGGATRSFTYSGEQRQNWDAVGAKDNQQPLLDTPEKLPKAVQGEWTLTPKAKSHKPVSFHVADGDKVSITEDNNGTSAFVLRANGSGQYFSTSPNPTYPNGHVETHPDNVREAMENGSRGHKEQRFGSGSKARSTHTVSRFVTQPPAHIGSVKPSDKPDPSTKVAPLREVKRRTSVDDLDEWARSRKIQQDKIDAATKNAPTVTTPALPFGQSGDKLALKFNENDTLTPIHTRFRSAVLVEHPDGSGVLRYYRGSYSGETHLDTADVERLRRGKYADREYLGNVPAPTEPSVSGKDAKAALANAKTLDEIFSAKSDQKISAPKPKSERSTNVKRASDELSATTSVSHVKATKIGENEHGKIWAVSSHHHDDTDLLIQPTDKGFQVRYNTESNQGPTDEHFTNVKAAKAWIDKNGVSKAPVRRSADKKASTPTPTPAPAPKPVTTPTDKPKAKVGTVSSVAHVKATKVGENEHGKIWAVSSHHHDDRDLLIQPTKNGFKVRYDANTDQGPTEESFPNVKAAKSWIDKNGKAKGGRKQVSRDKGESSTPAPAPTPEPKDTTPAPTPRKNGVPDNLASNASVYQVGDNIMVETPNDSAGTIERKLYLPNGLEVPLDHSAFDAMDMSKAVQLDAKTLEPLASRKLSAQERAKMVADEASLKRRTFTIKGIDGNETSVVLPDDLTENDKVFRNGAGHVFVQRGDSSDVTWYSAFQPNGSSTSLAYLRGSDGWDETKLQYFDPKTFKETTAPVRNEHAEDFNQNQVVPDYDFPHKDTIAKMYVKGDEVMYVRDTNTVYLLHEDGSAHMFSSYAPEGHYVGSQSFNALRKGRLKNAVPLVTSDYTKRNEAALLVSKYAASDKAVSDLRRARTEKTTSPFTGKQFSVPKFSADDEVYADLIGNIYHRDRKNNRVVQYAEVNDTVSILGPELPRSASLKLDPLTLRSFERPDEPNASVDVLGKTYRINAPDGSKVTARSINAGSFAVLVERPDGTSVHYNSDGTADVLPTAMARALSGDGVTLNNDVVRDDGSAMSKITAKSLSERFRQNNVLVKVTPPAEPEPKWGKYPGQASARIGDRDITFPADYDVYTTSDGQIWGFSKLGGNTGQAGFVYNTSTEKWEPNPSWNVTTTPEATLTRVYPPQEMSLDTVPKVQGSTAPRDVFDGVNPAYGAEGGYAINCTRATTAFELRQRGYDVEARQGSASMGASKIATMWADDNGETRQFTAVSGVSGINKATKNDPVGSRYFLTVSWKHFPAAHIFNAEKTADGIKFHDAQVGRFDQGTAGWADRAKDFQLLRVDDLTPIDAAVLRHVDPADKARKQREEATASWFDSAEKLSGHTFERREDGTHVLSDVVALNPANTRTLAIGIDEKRQTPVMGTLADDGSFVPDPLSDTAMDIASGMGGVSVPSAADISVNPFQYARKDGTIGTQLSPNRAGQYSTKMIGTTDDDWTDESGAVKFSSWWHTGDDWPTTVRAGDKIYRSPDGKILQVDKAGNARLVAPGKSGEKVNKRSINKTIREQGFQLLRSPAALEVSQTSDSTVTFTPFGGDEPVTLEGVSPRHDLLISRGGSYVQAIDPTTGERAGLWRTQDGKPMDQDNPRNGYALALLGDAASILRPSAHRLAGNPDYTSGTYLGTVFDQMVKELAK